MRVYIIALLGVIGLLACLARASKPAASKLKAGPFPTIMDSLMDDQDIIPTKRLLRASGAVTGNSEERVGFGTITGLVKSHVSKVVDTTRLKTWLLKNKTGAQVLDKLKLGDDIATALENTKLNSLRAYAKMFNKKNSNSKISVIGILTARYGDDEVAKALVSAQKKAATTDTAKLLRSEQLDFWLTSDKSVVDVFKLLKLSDDGYEALTSRKLEVLEKYIEFFNQKKSGHETLLGTFTTGFGGEEKLVPIIYYAMWDPRTQTKARELEAALLRRWRDENLQPDEVLKLLKLNGNMEHVLNSRRLGALVTYIPTYNNKNRDNQVSLLGVLMAHYSDDAVAKAIAAARRNLATEEIAKKLQSQQLEGWLKSGKSADDVFVLLKLKEDGPAAIGSPKLDTLDEYIKLLNTQKSGEETVIKALVTGFGGESNLMSILTTAKANTQVAVKAEKLETALLTQWKNEKFQPEHVFKLLKLDRDADNVLGSANLPVLMKYISTFNKHNPTHEVSLLGMLKAHYSDDMVAKAIVTAKRSPATEEIAKKLQTQQLEEWLNSGKSVNDVFTLLKLKEYGLAAIISRKMEMLEEYIKLFNREKSGHESVIKTLTSVFGGEGKLAVALETGRRYPRTNIKATELQSAQFSKWLDEGLDSMSVLTNVFKVKEENVARASRMEKSVAKQFKAFYEDNVGVLNGVRCYTKTCVGGSSTSSELFALNNEAVGDFQCVLRSILQTQLR
ncbi:unnamed protein product [Phytophthora fragariaefolia]|uniref:Unnamed protein product n=1 Tax=Phytophthora fragariaefolia TaxID=1490495 RepID=A0A9W7CTM6_9STRA|nr:unnamed protein product [Phytophthora fragariaefolia]